MQILLHPITKTAIEAKRGIERLKNFTLTYPNDELVESGAVSDMVDKLRELVDLIPSELQQAK